MRWDSSLNAGFTTGTPWLPVGPDVERCNVQAQSADDRSLLALYRDLLALRRSEPALVAGRYEAVRNQGAVLAFWRCLESRRLLIALNMSGVPGEFSFAGNGEVLLSTRLADSGKQVQRALRLHADEGVILTVD
jgi:alpha-glucosidase